MNPNHITFEERIVEHPQYGILHTYRRENATDDRIYILRNDIPKALGLKRFVVNRPIPTKSLRCIIKQQNGAQKHDMITIWSLVDTINYLSNYARAERKKDVANWIMSAVEPAWDIECSYKVHLAPLSLPEPEPLPDIKLPKIRLKKYIKKGEVKQYENMLKHLPGNETGRRENKKWLLSLIDQYADTRGIDTKEAWKVFVKQYDQDFGGDLLKEHRAFNRGRAKKQDLPRYFISTHKMYRACKSAYAMNMETKTQKIWWRNQQQKAMVLNRCS